MNRQKIKLQTLIGFYDEAIRLDEELQKFSDELFDAGLDQTSTSLGVDDAMKALRRTLSDLDRRIQYAKDDEKSNR